MRRAISLNGRRLSRFFGSRDHGDGLLTAGLRRKAVQYDIGNPLTAASMTRHALSAALYAPIRVLLREDDDDKIAFEYDRPVGTLGQFGIRRSMASPANWMNSSGACSLRLPNEVRPLYASRIGPASASTRRTMGNS